MGKLILSEGAPGTGKSRAIKNLDPKTTLIIKPNNKDLPFPGSRKLYQVGDNVVVTSSLSEVGSILRAANEGTRFKTVVIEDLTHYLNKRTMSEYADKGYEKWTRLAVDTFNSFIGVEDILRDDMYVIVIAHTQLNKADNSGFSTITLQTPGRLLEDSIKIPSYFTYVLHSDVTEDGEGKVSYYFLTNRDGSGREAKSPEGCLDLHEPNDYAAIISKIENYQNSI